MKKFLYILPIDLLIGSCKKALDINDNPNDPTSLAVEVLLPNAEKNLGYSLALGNGDKGGLSQVLSVYTHQLSTREEPNQYSATSNEYYLQLAWPTMYEEVVSDLDEIINASEESNKRFSGMAKILKAFALSQFVDVFGDIPFSEVNVKGVTYPKFDDDKEIYPQLIALLDEGIADMNAAPTGSTAADLIYNGDKNKWIKAANTIKLKLYTQIRKVEDVSAEVSQLLSDPTSLINNVNESFLIPYGPLGSTDDRNPGFGDYYATQRSNHVSPWLYEIMKGYNPDIFTGIKDPRVPYYIYNQLTKTGGLRDGLLVGQTEYRDSAFVTIYFGSVGEDRDRNQQKNISLLGIYPVGGRYDDGAGQVADVNSGTGAAPYRMITYADRLYLEAELIHTGVVTGDGKAVLQKAMEESFRQIDYVITTYVKPSTAGSPQTVPAIFNTPAMTGYIAEVMLDYDAASAEKKFEIVMTQKWLSSVGSSVDQYTDIRRTGYPKVFDPNALPNNLAHPPFNGDPAAPGAQQAVPVVLSRTYPFSLPWPAGELDVNSNAPEQKNPSSYKVFWQP
jgi:hypothetical protein